MLPLLARLYGAVVQQNPTTIPGLTKELADLTDLTDPKSKPSRGSLRLLQNGNPRKCWPVKRSNNFLVLHKKS